MNKELIERLANKAAAETYLLNPKIDPQDRDWELCTRFLAAVDAERGKEAVAWRVETGYDQPRYLFHSTQKPWGKSEPLFLAPQPVKGMRDKLAKADAVIEAAKVALTYWEESTHTEQYAALAAIEQYQKGE